MFAAVLKSFQFLSGRDRALIGLINSLRTLAHVLDVVGLAAVGILGAVLAAGLTDAPIEFLGIGVDISTQTDLLFVLIAMAGFFVLKSAISTILLKILTSFLASIEVRISTEITEFLFSGDLTRMRVFDRGELQWATGNSVHYAFTASMYAVSNLITESTLFLVIFAVFVIVDFESALFITGFFLLLFVLFQILITRRLKNVGDVLRSSAVEVNNTVLSLIDGFREISVLDRLGFFLAKFRQARNQAARAEASQRFLMGLPRFFVESGLMIGMLSLVLFQVLTGSAADSLITAGVFLAGGLRMMAALLPLQNSIAELRYLGPQAKEAHRALDLARKADSGVKFSTPEDFNNIGKNIQTSGPLHLLVADVSFQHADSKSPAVNRINLEAQPGQFIAIIGESGSGKSTLLDLILGLLVPDKGTVSIGGIDPLSARRHYRSQIGFVPQTPAILPANLASNVAMGIEEGEIDEERVLEALNQARLTKVLQRLGGNPSFEMQGFGDKFSGGEKQRIGISRALYTKPRLLVMDEATSALDAETEDQITSALEKMRGNVTIVVVAHRLSTVKRADRIFYMKSGHVVDAGTLTELVNRNAEVANFVRLLSVEPPL